MTPIHAQDPAHLLEEHFRRMAGQNAPLNPRLQVEAIGFSQYLGDWLGVVVTPDFVRLLLLPGGGSLWGDIPAGQRRYLELAGGTHTFFCRGISGDRPVSMGRAGRFRGCAARHDECPPAGAGRSASGPPGVCPNSYRWCLPKPPPK